MKFNKNQKSFYVTVIIYIIVVLIKSLPSSNMNYFKGLPHLLLALIFTFTLSASASNKIEKHPKVATEDFSGSRISFITSTDIGPSQLTIIGPDNFSASLSSPSGLPEIELTNFGEPKDGLYNYQMFMTLNGQFNNISAKPLNNGRSEKNHKKVNKALKQRGHFYIANGYVVSFEPSHSNKQ